MTSRTGKRFVIDDTALTQEELRRRCSGRCNPYHYLYIVLQTNR